MKKLMTLMLGMSLMFGAVATVFGQVPATKDEGKKKTPTKKGHKGGKKSKKGSGTTTPPPK
jgi:hypothetical protein